MNKVYPISQLQELLIPAQSILVVLPENPLFDQVASSLALFLSLEKGEKEVLVLASTQMTVEFSHLVGVDRVKNQTNGRNLVLTIDMPIENIGKVSSNDDGGKLNLIIQPKPGSASIDKEKIIFSSSGSLAGLVFTIGAQKLEDLGRLYRENENLFKEKPVINIDNHPQNAQYGQINIVNPQASSCSEIVVGLISGLGLPIEEDAASNLLQGLKRATENFQSQSVTAETFEAAAFCLRAGVRREEVEPTSAPSPDWLEPKIYKGSTLP